MKLRSIHYLASRSKESFLRFPFPILSAFVSTTAAIYLIEFKETLENPLPYINILLTTGLGISLYLCTTIIAIKHCFHRTQYVIITAIATILLIAVYFSLPGIETTHSTTLPYVRYTLLSVIAHLLVSFAPYAKDKDVTEFWSYNKMLFVRFGEALLYSVVLCVGLIIALEVITFLFHIDIKVELYAEICIFITCFFNTWFFVAGIPNLPDTPAQIKRLPKGLKIFTQYILLPLLSLYLIILYVYGTSIVAQWLWPEGIISYLITFVGVLGIFAHCLIYPYGNVDQNAWIKKFIRLYYYGLYPLIIFLCIAIEFRISDYGVTINRYIIVLLGVWLFAIALYFSVGKTNIKFIPISLALVLTLISFGPWGMFSVSEQSQLHRLTKILEQNSLLVNGKINNEVMWTTDQLSKFEEKNKNTQKNKVSDSVHHEINSILNYLDKYHGLVSVRPFFKQNVDSLISIALVDNKIINEVEVYTKTMGLEQINKFGPSNYTILFV